MINSFQDLNTRFAQVASQTHAITRKSAGAVGELFEQLMVGGVVGNDRGADFAAINTEAKVHHGKGVMTVFTFAPTTGMSATEFKDAHGSTVVRRGVANGKGGSVEVNGSMVNVTVGGVAVTGWAVAELSARIEEKMPNLAMVTATKKGNAVTFDRLAVCRKVIASRFVDSIARGDVVIEMRGNRGVTFRAMPSVIETWFETVH